MNNFCIICNSKNLIKFDNIHYHFKKDNSHFYCQDCTMIFLNKQKKINYNSTKYRNLQNNNVFFNELNIGPLDPWGIISYLRHENIAKEILKIKKKIYTWLDFGGYSGFMLCGVRDKIKVKTTVAEMDSRALRMCRFLGHKTIDLNYQKITSKYDVISLVQVLEHVPDPIKLLNDLKKNLNNEGLVYIEVPNVFNFPLSDNSHVNEFNLISLKNTAYLSRYSIIKHGFTSTHKFSNRLDWFYNNKEENIFVILKQDIDSNKKIQKIKVNSKLFFLRLYLKQNLILLTFAKNNINKIPGMVIRFIYSFSLFAIGLLKIIPKILTVILPRIR